MVDTSFDNLREQYKKLVTGAVKSVDSSDLPDGYMSHVYRGTSGHTDRIADEVRIIREEDMENVGGVVVEWELKHAQTGMGNGYMNLEVTEYSHRMKGLSKDIAKRVNVGSKQARNAAVMLNYNDYRQETVQAVQDFAVDAARNDMAGLE